MEDYGDISGQVKSREKSRVFFGKYINKKQALFDIMELGRQVTFYISWGTDF